MALGDPWIRARSDRPTHFTAGDCSPGALGLRWCVLSGTGIHVCQLLNLEDGVIVKYDREKSFETTPPTTTYFRDDTDLVVEYRIVKTTLDSPSQWRVLVLVNGTCLVRFTVVQPQGEELLTEIDADPVLQVGVCDADPMIDEMKAQFYRTEDAALVDWPDAQIWVWN